MKKKLTLRISGMHCQSCSKRIEKVVSSMSVEELEVSYEKGQLICITENADEIIEAINEMGYSAEKIEADGRHSKSYKGVLVALLVLFGFYVIIKNTVGFNGIPQLQEQASYPILFIMGIITSLHCLSMCGGIVLSQSMTFKNPIKSTLLYNVGRVIAYTTVGGIVGGIGSVVSFSPTLKGYITIFAGGFMILMGLSMLQPFSFLRKYVKLPSIFNASKFHQNSNTPLFIGLATGLMPCGPLQTMQLYALGTGSALKGALAMFVFSIGTVPLMMGLGTISGYISMGLNRKLLKLSSVLVMVLGLIIVNRGFALQGKTTLTRLIAPKQTVADFMLPEMTNGFQLVTTYANSKGYEPNLFILEKGKAVKWVVIGDSINGCNNEIVIPALGIKQNLKEGYNIIEFTPEADGQLGFSCWMGMLDGSFIVVEDINNIPSDLNVIPSTPVNCCTP